MDRSKIREAPTSPSAASMGVVTFFLVQGVNGDPACAIACRSTSESRMLFQVKLRAMDPFQRMRDVGSDRPAERIRK